MRMMVLSALTVLATAALCACAHSNFSVSSSHKTDRVKRSSFGKMPDGRDVDLYRITNANGMEVSVTPYGGHVTSLTAPDADGNFEDVVLGFGTLNGYRSDQYQEVNPYFGAIIGRYGNRIANGRFSLNGKTYELATNDGPNHLHGGQKGFNRKLWKAEPFENDDSAGVVLRYTSPAGEEGYPGRLKTKVTYTLTDANELVINYEATTTKATPVNLTHHSYFNLAGEGDESILDEELIINADAFTPTDSTAIPTGEIRSVAGTPFDFRQFTPIGARIDADNTQIEYAGGYDHNYVLNREGADANELVQAARVWDPGSGRLMSVSTTEPGLQFYSGNFLQGHLAGKSGQDYEHRSGFALETQHFPNSPNESSFPSTILHPDETYRSTTSYAFDAQDSVPSENQ